MSDFELYWTDSIYIEIDQGQKAFKFYQEINHVTHKQVRLTSHETRKIGIFEYVGKSVDGYRKVYSVTPNTVALIPELDKWHVVFLGNKRDDI